MFPPNRNEPRPWSIVDRLMGKYTEGKIITGAYKPNPICIEAAEEILRLRAILDEIGVKYL